MDVDPQLSIQAGQMQPNIGGVIQNQQTQDSNMAQSAEQTLKAHYDNMSTREQSRLRSTVVGAAQLKTYLDKGDVEGAHDFLTKRQQSLHTRMASGEDVDDQETAYALDKLRKGDIQGLQNDVASIAAAGQAYGMIGGTGAPSSVQEWQYYNSLPPDQQGKYIEMKRANQLIDRGGSVEVVGKGGAPVRTVDKTLAPADEPANAEAKANAAARGNAIGAEQGAAAAKLEAMNAQMPSLNAVVDKLHKAGQTATYTATGGGIDSVTRQLGAKVPQRAVDLTTYITTIDNELLPLLRQTFGSQFTAEEGTRLKATLGDVKLSPPEKDAALKAFIEAKMREIQNLQRQTGKPVSTVKEMQNAGNAADTPPVAGTIKVSNGKETEWVLPANLQAAQAEGFQPVQ